VSRTHELRVPATLYEWPKGTPHKYDIGRALMEYQLRRAM
jgi:hypothetical protein